MSVKFNSPISAERLAAFLDGNVSAKEASEISRLIASSDFLKEEVNLSMDTEDALDLDWDDISLQLDDFKIPVSLDDIDLPNIIDDSFSHSVLPMVENSLLHSRDYLLDSSSPQLGYEDIIESSSDSEFEDDSNFDDASDIEDSDGNDEQYMSDDNDVEEL